MDVKQAARTARDYITDLFADENVQNIGLEEVEFDDIGKIWNITIGFSRPWESPKDPPKSFIVPVLQELEPPPPPNQRSYKIVRVRDHDGHILSVMNRALAAHN